MNLETFKRDMKNRYRSLSVTDIEKKVSAPLSASAQEYINAGQSMYWYQEIPGDHLRDHAVQRCIVTDGLDQVVTEPPRILERQRPPAPGRLREPCHVHEV